MATAANVSVGKPKLAGGVYIAATTVTLPTDATTALATGFSNLGYVSEDGVTNSRSKDTNDIAAWGGDNVLSVGGSASDTFKMTFIESMNIDVLKAVYGDGNVSGTLSAGISISVNNGDLAAKEWVIDMLLTGGGLKRIVIPHGTITEIGDVVYKDDDPIGYEVTIMAAPDASGNTHYEYIKKT